MAAGVYQWRSLKERCLRECRAPLTFIRQQGGFRRDARSALLLGLKHGAYCLGCCWILMAILFVGGVMNLLWIAAIAMLVLAEKVLPPGWLISRISGFGFIASGGWLLLRSAM
jgi:predicted metal-binding membrane protein